MVYYNSIPANICSSWRHAEDVYKTYLEDVFNTPSAKQFLVFQGALRRLPKTFWTRFKRIFGDVLKTSWKTKDFYAEDVLKTSSKHVLKAFWRHTLKTSWRPTKYLLGISISNKCKSVSHKSISFQICIWRI